MIAEAKFMLDAMLATLAHRSGTAEAKYECDLRQWMGQVEPWGSKTSGIATKRLESLPLFGGSP